MTLFGEYKGLRPPPRRKSKDEVWSGTTAASVPPVSSDGTNQLGIGRHVQATHRVSEAKTMAKCGTLQSLLV